jgi:tRNA-modifying protein YgfZ
MADVSEEYRIVARGAGWRHERRRGRLRIEGRDAGSFLHALLTADVASVPAGGGVYSAYLTPHGRMISDLALYRHGDSWLADVPPGLAASLVTRLENLIFTEDVHVTDASDSIGLVSVIGRETARILGSAIGVAAELLHALPVRANVHVNDVMIARTDAATLPTFDLFMPAARVAEVATALGQAGAVELHDETAEMFRIEAGRPAFGVDMHTDTIPLEAGLVERAISLTKGCYVGQEVIIRVLHRGAGRVAKRLMRMEAAGAEDSITAGSVIVAADRDVGQVTSAAWSPARDRSIALGYIHRDAAIDGQLVVIQSPRGDSKAVIVGPAG